MSTVEHTWGEWVEWPTIGRPGRTCARTCLDCGASMSEYRRDGDFTTPSPAYRDPSVCPSRGGATA